jgi:hypothetical protein
MTALQTEILTCRDAITLARQDAVLGLHQAAAHVLQRRLSADHQRAEPRHQTRTLTLRIYSTARIIALAAFKKDRDHATETHSASMKAVIYGVDSKPVRR